ncbi:InlB B-repeat-containing protein [Bifidobacterium saguinibicoloris]|uniref:InlB B-repeat-containing protein n=1 Tax=Bifidobacterium saguinibicoloris TaxID=2834433 RepID=UPI001C59BE3F|nr:InlB B-repeat-containing protein [Bifidobacterium saguinibicoloris]MBW3080171.1 InlB B-repeat-containing protein [Bifidobacterium saguinibicoloris]
MTMNHDPRPSGRWMKLLAIPAAVATLIVGVPAANAAEGASAQSESTTTSQQTQSAASAADAAQSKNQTQSASVTASAGKTAAAGTSSAAASGAAASKAAASGKTAASAQPQGGESQSKATSSAVQSPQTVQSAQTSKAATATQSQPTQSTTQQAQPKAADEPVYGYTITFDSQGGTPVDHTATWMKNDATGSNSEEWSDKVTKPTREGFRFVCWSTQKSDKACDHDLWNLWFSNDGITSDMTVYAQWAGIAVRVYIGSETSGNFVDMTNGDIPADNPKFVAPAKDGCTFDHWSTDEDGTVVFDPTKPLASAKASMSAYPQYLCTITFDTQGGDPIASIQAPTGQPLTNLPTPTRSGYTFVQWTYDAAGDQRFFDTRQVRNAFTLYAQWKENAKYTITFDSQGGSDIGHTAEWWANDTTTHNDTEWVNHVNIPDRTGYRFQCWSTQKDDVECTHNLRTVWKQPDGITSDMTVYAQWEAIAVRIYIGSKTSGKYVTVNYGDVPANDPKLVAPAKDGCTFGHWSLGEYDYGTFDPSQPLDEESDFSIYPQYLCTVTFDAQGGDAVAPVQAATSHALTNLPTPTREGYTFTGWTYDAAGDQEFVATRKVNKAFTLYAQWKVNEYTVSFDANGGSAVDAQTVEYGKTVTKPADPTREGYTFAGWTTDEAGKTAYDFATPVSGDLTLYAQWTVNEYTVSFDANGGSSVDAQTVEYGKTVTKPADPTREGYTFAGWTTDKDGKTAYDFATPVSGDLTLYAQWTKNAEQPGEKPGENGGSTPTTPSKPNQSKPSNDAKKNAAKKDNAKQSSAKTAKTARLSKTGSSVAVMGIAVMLLLAAAGMALAVRRNRD